MTATCIWLKTCQFYQIYMRLEDKESGTLSRDYCHGPYNEQCIRKIFKGIYHKEAVDNLGPDGKIYNLFLHK